jgi:hypothetical protein
MVVAGRLFIVLGIFGLLTGGSYWYLQDTELAGVQLLLTFCVASVFIGLILLRFSPAHRARRHEPDTGLVGSADPERGAADERGNIHTMSNTMAPFAYSLAALVLLAGIVYREALWGPWGIAFGLAAAVVATAIWYRDVSADAHAALQAPHGGGHAAATDTLEPPPGPPTAANYFEQLRQALEAGDPDWAADAYAAEAVYYEPANPPHEGRESIRAYLNDFLKGHRDLTWSVQRMGADGQVAIVEWSLSFTARGGRQVSGQSGVTVIEAGPAGITYHRDYL